MGDIDLYRDSGLALYEKVHYSKGEHIRETAKILSWYRRSGSRILDIGCSGGLHAIELAKAGHFTTGIDREASAIELARERCGKLRLKARFFVADIEKDAVGHLGKFDLVICIGNVISHINKELLPVVLKKIRSRLEMGGFFLFDFLVAGSFFPEEVLEEDLGIVWKRKLDLSSGKIALTGYFTDFGFNAKFDLWGYTREEIIGMLAEADFVGAAFSCGLDFTDPVETPENQVCLRCLAQAD